MDSVSSEDQQILDIMKKVATEVLDYKKRLGQYAVVWREGRPVTLGEDRPFPSSTLPHGNTPDREKRPGGLDQDNT